MRPLPQCWVEGIIKETKFRPKYRHACLGFLGKLFVSCPTGELELPERYEMTFAIEEVLYHGGEIKFKSCEGLYPSQSLRHVLMEKPLVRDVQDFVAGKSLLGLLSPPAPATIWMTSYEVIPPGTKRLNALAAIRRAEECLALLRAKKWNEATDCVAAEWQDSKGWQQTPLDRPGHPRSKEFRGKAKDLLARVYGTVQPGRVMSLRFISTQQGAGKTPNPGERVTISYRHDDLDGFEMILSDSRWYRILDLY